MFWNIKFLREKEQHNALQHLFLDLKVYFH